MKLIHINGGLNSPNVQTRGDFRKIIKRCSKWKVKENTYWLQMQRYAYLNNSCIPLSVVLSKLLVVTTPLLLSDFLRFLAPNMDRARVFFCWRVLPRFSLCVVSTFRARVVFCPSPEVLPRVWLCGQDSNFYVPRSGGFLWSLTLVQTFSVRSRRFVSGGACAQHYKYLGSYKK
jgi:hypothetical protein